MAVFHKKIILMRLPYVLIIYHNASSLKEL